MKNAAKKLKTPLGLSLLAAALTAAALAAVSVAQDDGGKATGPEEMEAFRSCMERNGAPAPPEPPAAGEEEDGTFERRLEPPTEEERAKIDEAFEACRDELPEGVRHFGPGGPGSPGGPCGPPPAVRPKAN
jgi:hypothetical protein